MEPNVSAMEECITASEASPMHYDIAQRELSLEHSEKTSSNAFHHFSDEKCVSELPF